MALTNTRDGWGLMARLLHWGLAVLIIFQLGVGLYMVQVVGDDLIQRFNLTQMHKSWGVIVILLVAIRILWRAASVRPAHPPMPAWQETASKTSHILLYVLMVALPVSGWMMASASPLNDAGAYVQIKNQVTLQYLFGKDALDAVGLKEMVLFEMPDLFDPGDKHIEAMWKEVHFWSAMGLIAILAAHIAGALKHQLIDRDGLLRKMIIGR
ncbi:MAG: cytochrome b [Pikeienuella sp.]